MRGGNGMKKMFWIYLTNDCNLACRYCFQRHQKREMSPLVAERVVEFITSDPGDDLHVQFYGGEPTLKWDLMWWMIEKIRAKRPKTRFTFTTNGTLLDRTRLRKINEEGVSFALSIDGPPEVQNKSRPLKGGGESFDKIPLADIAGLFPGTQIIMVADPVNSPELIRSTRFFVERGFSNIAHNPDFSSCWTDVDISLFKTQVKLLMDYYIDLYLVGKKVNFMWLGWAMKNIRASQARITQVLCGLNNNLMAIDTDGKIYPCQGYINCRSELAMGFSIGDVFSGVDAEKKEAGILKKDRMRPPKGADCDHCFLRFKCEGGCLPENLALTGDRYQIRENHCRLLKIILPEATRALIITGQISVGALREPPLKAVMMKLQEIERRLSRVPIIQLEKVR
jgi:uncharacterized protein